METSVLQVHGGTISRTELLGNGKIYNLDRQVEKLVG